MLHVVFSFSQLQCIHITNIPHKVRYMSYVLFYKYDIVPTNVSITQLEQLDTLYSYVTNVKPHYHSIIL